MPITQNRMLILVREATELMEYTDMLHEILKRYKDSRPDMWMTVVSLPRPQCRAIVAEGTHFKKFARRNEREAIRMKARRGGVTLPKPKRPDGNNYNSAPDTMQVRAFELPKPGPDERFPGYDMVAKPEDFAGGIFGHDEREWVTPAKAAENEASRQIGMHNARAAGVPEEDIALQFPVTWRVS